MLINCVTENSAMNKEQKCNVIGIYLSSIIRIQIIWIQENTTVMENSYKYQKVHTLFWFLYNLKLMFCILGDTSIEISLHQLHSPESMPKVDHIFIHATQSNSSVLLHYLTIILEFLIHSHATLYTWRLW